MGIPGDFDRPPPTPPLGASKLFNLLRRLVVKAEIYLTAPLTTGTVKCQNSHYEAYYVSYSLLLLRSDVRMFPISCKVVLVSQTIFKSIFISTNYLLLAEFSTIGLIINCHHNISNMTNNGYKTCQCISTTKTPALHMVYSHR